MNPEPLKYPIPHKYFPSVKVTKTFYAEVTYKVVARKVIIEKVAFDEKCLDFMTNHKRFKDEMKEVLQKTEDTIKRNSHVPNTIMASIAPFINY
jgi:uncharacterized protein YecE (DUF72 family)